MSSVEEKTPKKPSLRVQIEQVKLKHDDLSKRSADPKIARDLIPEVFEFIEQLRKMGRDVPPGANRDLLISLASYWAMYYFQHSEENTYPSTTLEPYLGAAKGGEASTISDVFQKIMSKPESTSTWLGGAAEEPSAPQAAANWFLNLPIWGRILVIVAPLVVVGLIAVVLSSIFPTHPSPPPTSTATDFNLSGTQVALQTSIAQMTEVASMGPTNTQVALATATAPATSTLESTHTPSSGSTSIPQDTPLTTPTGGVGIENQGVIVSIENLNDLQEVLPKTWLSLSYANFTPGWSIHLLLQPLSKGLTYYPVPDYYLVEEGYGSGMWSVAVNFGTGGELDYQVQYAITPVMAINDGARQVLSAAVENGLERLPEGVFTSPQLITRVYTVVRRAYQVVNEVRIVYSAYPPKASNSDLFAMLPDGSDPIQLTDTPEISERYASVSPTGSHIVFVGRTQASGDAPRQYSLWIMSSDNSNRFSIAQDPALIYDRPLWSPESNLIVYNTSPADASVKGALASWGIYLYDLLSGQTIRLDTGLTYARHPAWTPDGKALYFSALNQETGTLGIYQINLDTKEVRRVYDEKGNEIQPMVSPDGDRLLFQDYDTGELYVLNLVSGSVEKVKTPRALDLGYAVWSPDGEWIYFEANVSSAYAIWVVNVRENEPRQLTPGETELDPSVGLLVVYLPK